MEKIEKIAKNANIPASYLESYGFYKAKINMDIYKEISKYKDGKLILVTAITPTKFGEGKTTISIALTDGLAKIKEKALLCLREPSLGPVFGLKGGATGGGKASIVPQEEINLHFTGDMHALTTSINLISAVIDNHIYRGNELGIDPKRVLWKRALDINDRSLREVKVGIGEKNGVERMDNFQITVASELMAILCLAKDGTDFLNRIKEIIVAYSLDNKPIKLKDLKISHAVMKLMKEALKPNLVQTLENNPVLVHGGPFANIAHGCSSIISLNLALKLADYVVTEAGFGADLGAEKFFDICAPSGGLKPDGAVLVATIRALKAHADEKLEGIDTLLDGAKNLKAHAENIKKFGVPFLIAINRFDSDSDEEIDALMKWGNKQGYEIVMCDAFSRGGEGAIDLAKGVKNMLSKNKSNYHPLYDVNLPIKNKITLIAKSIYGAGDVIFTKKALENIGRINDLGYDKTPICMAKTPLSLSDDPTLVGVPTNFKVTIKDVYVSAGANFVVALLGDIMTMPGLPAIPRAVKMEEEPI